MNYQINKYGELESKINKTEDVQEGLFENVSLFYDMNRFFFASQDYKSMKIVVLTIMKSNQI